MPLEAFITKKLFHKIKTITLSSKKLNKKKSEWRKVRLKPSLEVRKSLSPQQSKAPKII